MKKSISLLGIIPLIVGITSAQSFGDKVKEKYRQVRQAWNMMDEPYVDEIKQLKGDQLKKRVASIGKKFDDEIDTVFAKAAARQKELSTLEKQHAKLSIKYEKEQAAFAKIKETVEQDKANKAKKRAEKANTEKIKADEKINKAQAKLDLLTAQLKTKKGDAKLHQKISESEVAFRDFANKIENELKMAEKKAKILKEQEDLAAANKISGANAKLHLIKTETEKSAAQVKQAKDAVEGAKKEVEDLKNRAEKFKKYAAEFMQKA